MSVRRSAKMQKDPNVSARRQVQRHGLRERIMKGSEQNGARNAGSAREQYGSTRRVDQSISAHTGLSRGVPADHEVQSQVKKEDSCKREGTLREGLTQKQDCIQQNSKTWELQLACMPERECHQNSRREVACDSEKRSSCSSMRNAQHMTQRMRSEKSDDRERDMRIDDHPAMPDDPTDHAVAKTTQWCWRPLANCSGKVSHRPDREAGGDL